MNRRTFIRSSLNRSAMAAAIVAVSFGLSAPAHAEIEEGKLLVWINGDKGYDGLQEVGDWFTEETGIPVEVAHPDSATDKFQQSAATGNGPDIFIWAHDRFGEWAQSGIISEIKPSQKVVDANFDFTWDAVTVDGKKYGYPMAVESIGLIYNKDLAVEFLENYALSIKGLKMVNDDVPLGAVANKEFMDELSSNPNIAATFENAELGKPMPSVPAMGAFWSSMGPALQNITSGRQSVEDALNSAAQRITR